MYTENGSKRPGEAILAFPVHSIAIANLETKHILINGSHTSLYGRSIDSAVPDIGHRKINTGDDRTTQQLIHLEHIYMTFEARWWHIQSRKYFLRHF